MNDLRFALRQLLKHPGFTAVAVLTLALGIGANTAIFSVIHAVLIRPFPYADQEQIVFLSAALRKEAQSTSSVNLLDLEDWRTQSTSFAAMGGSQDAQFVVTGVTEPARVKGANVSPSVLELLRVPPSLGRLLTPDDDRPGAPRVCVLTDRAWERFFSRRTDVVGKTIVLNGNSHEVVGVMPPTFKFWDAWVYVPLVHGISPDMRNLRGVTVGIWGIGRLKPGVSPKQAAEELDIISRRIEAAYPAENRDRTANVRVLAETVGAGLRPTLFLLFGAVGCVLLIACVNVTNLLLARGASRERELAVRAALGATRGRLVRQLLAETLPIGLLAALIGSLLAWWGLILMLAVIPVELIPAEATIRLSLPVLAFTGAVSVLTALAAGLLPAWQTSRTRSSEALKSGGRSASAESGTRIRAALVVTEVALAFTLLIGAGLLIRNLVQVARTDPGFRVENVLVGTLQLPEARYPDTDRSLAIVRDLSERVRGFPGVLHAGVMGSVPMGGATFSVPLLVAGRSYARQDELRSTTYNAVSPGAMEAVGLRLKEGRFFDETDRAGSERVAILNTRSAKELFGTESPLGKQVASGVPKSFLGDQPATGMVALLVDPPFARVIGVVESTRQFALTVDPQPEVYYPYEQSIQATPVRNNFSLVLHTAGDPAALTSAVRRELRAVDSELPLDSVRTMSVAVSETLRGQRFVVVLLGAFAGVALLLAVVGIYSVMTWMVSQRTRELGIRLALGASPEGMIGMVVRQGSRPVLVGLVLGVGLALGLSRVLASQLVNIQSTDLLTYLSVAVGLLMVALLACWLPARRAARVDPMVALRSE